MPTIDTPWGIAEHVEELSDGLFAVSTASHGGLRLMERVQKRLTPDVLDTFRNGPNWAEEDCEAPIVLTLLGLASAGQKRVALAVSMQYQRYRPALARLEEDPCRP